MLDSKQCEAFLAVAEIGSFDAAGEHLYITPSAVSLRVQALEKYLGQILIIRGRPCLLTQAGQTLLQHLRHTRLMEQNLLQGLMGKSSESDFYKIALASNADSLATWLLPSIQQTLFKEKIVLELKIDDQSHTHTLLETGQVNACISAEEQVMSGCLAQPLGKMRYKMLASAEFAADWFKHGVTRETLRNAPAVIFNHKDLMHSEVLLKYYGLPLQSYPYSFIPATDAFVKAIQLGLGYGMVPELQVQSLLTNGTLVDVIPEAELDIPLYWHHWKRQSKQLDALTETIVESAKHLLR
ncbi:LysR family transcriptional regulator ArgP [Acinetobacter sp. V91_7]|uniref:LysR family transcriptional regulator ArgP n=1 Tax=unclassified Acinetobacter TaxID=196816 RepID=UPI00287BD0E6|nr:MULTISPECIES: LysR family transcriptional regulator ArgP [unclassified Acinetobacter]MDS7933573.1 LysR family transcriptional regulator ArgP [Acinetobacter sp. V91_4B]MDS7965405.1 LysR family transcriptional regulator ArgP [Acinetobacter sp. V91_7]MDS8029234.1 LysR family transcriptional regulator ArgP [Acinetobacter sp. V91_13]